MTILTGAEAAGLVESMIDEGVQIQMCGIELTLARIERFLSAGALGYENIERQLPETELIQFDESGWIMLEQGSYLVTFNEIVNIPKDIAALGRPRSSLLRSGVTLGTALWDPGYRGRSQSLLVVHNPLGIRLKKNARLMQLVFFRLGRAADKTYSGIYQNENV
ncbi:MAG: deoxyuridine 5'-triphosphate nucleotidohydrolase [Methanotrichaceae archaeon]